MKKVLLASASRLFLERNLELLQLRGFQLFAATRGAEAVRLHERHRFDLIISDMLLEETDGCTLCSLLLKVAHVPVILVCHNNTANIQKVEKSGAIAALLKPVNPIQLIEMIGKFVELRGSKSKRVEFKADVLAKTSDREFRCLSHDISNTGMLLASEHQLSLGERIHFRFTLPSSLHVETESTVIRTMNTLERNTLYGVQFIDPPLSHRSAIDSYVSSCLTSGSNDVTLPTLKPSAVYLTSPINIQ